MRLFEIADKESLIKPSNIDKKGNPLKLPNAYDNVNYGKQDDVERQTVTVKDTKTGKIYGRRTLHGKKTKGKGIRESFLKEGGNVFKDQSGNKVTQRISKYDIFTTLQWLESITNLPLRDNMLGTTGKKQSSGDIDVGIDQTSIDKKQLAETLKQWVKQNIPNSNPDMWVKKSGSSVHFKTPINGDPENGFVQTDLMFGDPEWMKFALQGSDVDNSPFKGSHRHILMNSIAKHHGLKWSYTRGLVSRTSNNIVAQEPDYIAEVLLGKNADRTDLNSVESILQKIKDDPDYDQLVADARKAFEQEGLSLPTQIKEGTEFLYELYYNKPKEVDIIMNTLDDMYGTKIYDDIVQLLQSKDIDVSTPDQTYQTLMQTDETKVHQMFNKIARLTKDRR